MRKIAYWVEIPVKTYLHAGKFHEVVFVVVRELAAVPPGTYGRFPPHPEILWSRATSAEREEHGSFTRGPIIYLDNGKGLIIPISKGICAGGKVLFPGTQLSASSFDSQS
jgi:hypothetical protein